MEESRLRLFVMNQILDEGMDETHYPLYDAIVSTADWFMIFAHVDQNHGQLWRFFFANNEWRILNCNGLPSFFTHLNLFLVNERYLIVHGTQNQYQQVYKTYIGDLNTKIVNFQVIGTLKMNSVINMSENQIVGHDVDHIYLVHGYRTDTDFLTVYRLLIKLKKWSIFNKGLLRWVGSNKLPKNRVLYYNNKLFVFPIVKNESKEYDDFSRMFVFDLSSKTWRTVHTMPDPRTMKKLLPPSCPLTGDSDVPANPGIPAPRREDGYALMPYDPFAGSGLQRYAFLMGSPPASDAGGPSASPWESWRLDLQTLRWRPWLLDGPSVPSNGRFCATITPTGRLYVDRGGPELPWGGRVYGAWIVQPPRDDQEWDALMYRHRHRIFVRDDLSDRALYTSYGLPRRLAVKIRHAHTGVYEEP